jgi:outer membrane PBP1 activator LpoA protein
MDIGYHSAAVNFCKYSMPKRIPQALFLSSFLLILASCSSNAPRQDDGFSSASIPEPAPIKDISHSDQDPFGLLRDPTDRSLVEVEALSASLISYQPDLVLEIIRSLEIVSSQELKALIDQQDTDPEFAEWLELALQVRTVVIAGSSSAVAAEHWANYHYGHMVNRNNFPGLVTDYRAFFPVPSQVAILLPTEGGLSTAAKAIRDGIMSAYLDQPGDAVIRFYSSGENSESAIAAYQQASDDGAMHIIGPLDINSTRSIASLDEPATPVLLLNDMNSGIEDAVQHTDGINSLSLSTTEEATAIALKALSQGQRAAIMMIPDSAWGRRIESAFSTTFEQGGGQIAAAARFNTAESDHSAMLTQLLKIDESKQRKTDLQAWLGITLTFEPSQRNDYDFIFLAANPAEGRELKPLLRFHDVGDMPVYAMGRIYSGRIKRASDQDLNGIIFPTTRWQLPAASGNRESTSLESVRGGAYGNLYALGQDAWRLLPWLPLMQKDADLWFPGKVGSLRLQADGSLYREPAWAQFSAGSPTAYQWPHVEKVSFEALEEAGLGHGNPVYR